MNVLRVVVLLSVLAVAAALADETNALPTKITIGTETYEDVTWGTVTPSTVSIRHKSGVARIPLEKLPPDLQKQFGYDPKEVVEQAKAEHKKAILRQAEKKKFKMPLSVGAVGFLDGVSITQIVSEKELLAEITVWQMGSYSIDAYGQVTTAALEPRSIPAFIKGVSTRDLTDTSGSQVRGAFKITGTKASGKQTIWVLEPYSPE